MGITHHDSLETTWEDARGLLREELEGIALEVNRLRNASTVTGTIDLAGVEGDPTTGTKVITNNGTANAPKWDLVSLTTGVSGRLPFSHFITASANKLLGRRDTSSGNFEELTLGSGLAISGTTISADIDASDLGTTLTPQFARVGLGVAADSAAVLKAAGQIYSVEVDDGNSGTTKTINWNDGNVHYLTLTGNVTLTLSNPKGGARYTLVIATGAGGFTVTWPAAVLWPGGTPPTITATASKVDVVQLTYSAVSSKYYGTFTQNY